MTKDPVIQKAQRIVVKVGSSLVTNEGKGLDHQALARWATQIAALTHLGKQVILVSSGAIAEGILRLGWTQRPNDVHQLQAAAAVGQMGLAQAYESCFRHHDLHCAQILLTHADLVDRQRYLNARSTLFTLMELGVIPIINENDTVVTDEIKVGDNDTLGALVTNLVEADALVILTDQQGLYSADPRKNPNAVLIEHDQAGRLELESIAGGAGTAIGTGGMLTKILAAKRAARSGASTVIASGREPDVLLRLAAGESLGTTLHAPIERLSARKQWLADHLQLKGYVSLDQGASVALKQGGKSLLAIGVTAVEGDFGRGDVIACLDPDGVEIARGLTNYAASETRLIMRKPSHQINAILGSMNGDDLIHRDNMIINQIKD